MDVRSCAALLLLLLYVLAFQHFHTKWDKDKHQSKRCTLTSLHLKKNRPTRRLSLAQIIPIRSYYVVRVVGYVKVRKTTTTYGGVVRHHY